MSGAGRLIVHPLDDSGPLTVDGTVTARETPPDQFTSASRASLAGEGCATLLTAPADRAIVVKTILINVHNDMTRLDEDYVE